MKDFPSLQSFTFLVKPFSKTRLRISFYDFSLKLKILKVTDVLFCNLNSQIKLYQSLETLSFFPYNDEQLPYMLNLQNTTPFLKHLSCNYFQGSQYLFKNRLQELTITHQNSNLVISGFLLLRTIVIKNILAQITLFDLISLKIFKFSQNQIRFKKGILDNPLILCKNDSFFIKGLQNYEQQIQGLILNPSQVSPIPSLKEIQLLQQHLFLHLPYHLLLLKELEGHYPSLKQLNITITTKNKSILKKKIYISHIGLQQISCSAIHESYLALQISHICTSLRIVQLNLPNISLRLKFNCFLDSLFVKCLRLRLKLSQRVKFLSIGTSVQDLNHNLNIHDSAEQLEFVWLEITQSLYDMRCFTKLKRLILLLDDVDPNLIPLITRNSPQLKELKIEGNLAISPICIQGSSVTVLDLSNSINISKAKLKVPEGITIITD